MNRTEIANYALALIGNARITSLDESSVLANRLKDMLPFSERAVLREFDWPSMIGRASLNRLVTTPDNAPYAYAYAPLDWSRLINVVKGSVYLYEGDYIYSDDVTLTVKYIKPPQEEYHDIGLSEAISLHLAMRAAIDIAKDESLQAMLAREYEKIQGKAIGLAIRESDGETQPPAGWFQ